MRYNFSTIDSVADYYLDADREAKSQAVLSRKARPEPPFGPQEALQQDNFSFSTKGVLRGLHFQHNPNGQGKLVRVMTGKALDVVVDLRKDSPTFGQHEKFVLDAQKGNMLYVPPGFAHGFIALEETIFVYKCTDFWNKGAESGIRWNDPNLAIDWTHENPIISDKDQLLPLFDLNETIFN